jgi:hypothetical protein
VPRVRAASASADILLKHERDYDDYISAGMILRGGLKKGHKCADEPWD